MSRPVVSSDLHLGHRNITKYRSQFGSNQEHDDYVIAQHKATLKPNDTWFCFGDVAFSLAGLSRIRELNCKRKVLLLGNHELDNDIKLLDLLSVFDDIYSLKKHKAFGKVMLFSHAPIHPDELRGATNVHGHGHEHVIDDPRYINVCIEHTNYGVLPLEEILCR